MLKGHMSGVRTVSFSPDSQTLATGGDDGMIQFWNVDTGRQMLSIEAAWALLDTIISPDGNTLVWGEADSVRVMPLPSLAEIDAAEIAKMKRR